MKVIHLASLCIKIAKLFEVSDAEASNSDIRYHLARFIPRSKALSETFIWLM